MASELPRVPRLVFTILEPISLIGGCLGAFIDPDWFLSEQISSPANHAIAHTDNARLVALQLGNCYGLLCLVGFAVLNTTTELKVVNAYLWALWIADLGHIGLTFWLLGYDRSVALSDWNAMTWGNIGATAFLCLIRTAYFMGIFGSGNKTVSKLKKLS